MARAGTRKKSKRGSRPDPDRPTVEEAAERERQREREREREKKKEEAEAAAAPRNADTLSSAVLGLSKLYANCGKDGVSSQTTDAITQALLLILGSGPSIAALDELMNVQVSNGIMYHNAVANQQKTNLLGMAMTARCVRYMLDPRDDEIDETIISDIEKDQA